MTKIIDKDLLEVYAILVSTQNKRNVLYAKMGKRLNKTISSNQDFGKYRYTTEEADQWDKIQNEWINTMFAWSEKNYHVIGKSR